MSRSSKLTESSFGKCKTCYNSYYLDKKDNVCKKRRCIFKMKQTLNGKKCDICEDDYYFDEEGNCFGFNFCSKGRE